MLKNIFIILASAVVFLSGVDLVLADNNFTKVLQIVNALIYTGFILAVTKLPEK